MKRSRTNPWIGIGFDTWRLGLEASAVIGMRTMKIAAGGAPAQAESELMIKEKIASGATLQMMALTGELGASPAAAASKTLAHYRRKVRANRRRLSKV